jgi:spore germination protein YaaH
MHAEQKAFVLRMGPLSASPQYVPFSLRNYHKHRKILKEGTTMRKQVFFMAFTIVALLLVISVKEVLVIMGQKSLTTMAWLYPDKIYDTSGEISDGRHIDILKPQYYNLNDNGTLTQITSGYNAYNSSNIALVKKYSSQQFVTISGSTTGMSTLAADKTLTTSFINTILNFLNASKFTGIELDFEGFGTWISQQYGAYKTLVTAVGNALHAKSYKLMIDGPAISDAIYQRHYLWKWEDFNTLPVDYLVVMGYDYMYDQGAGAPVAPLSWLSNICQWMLEKITDHNRIVVGLNSYGYHGNIGSYNITKDTYEQSTQLPGFSTATRDKSSSEMTWTNENVFYDYSDSTTLQDKLNIVQNLGITNISVWHLGGNQWFPS